MQRTRRTFWLSRVLVHDNWIWFIFITFNRHQKSSTITCSIGHQQKNIYCNEYSNAQNVCNNYFQLSKRNMSSNFELTYAFGFWQYTLMWLITWMWLIHRLKPDQLYISVYNYSQLWKLNKWNKIHLQWIFHFWFTLWLLKLLMMSTNLK